MDKKAAAILKKSKDKKVGVFIDDANIFHSQKRVKWQIDWRNFKDVLRGNFKIMFIKYYRGVYSYKEKIDQKTRKKHDQFSSFICNLGFELIKRPLKKIYTSKKRNKYKYKCDFDAEIGFDIASETKNVDLVILVSGDSDYSFLVNKLKKRNQDLLVICFKKNAPWEFYRVSNIFFEEIKDEIIFTKKTPR